jgi:hypothetical protein
MERLVMLEGECTPLFRVSRGNKGVTGEWLVSGGNKGVSGLPGADERVERSEMVQEQRPLSMAGGA